MNPMDHIVIINEREIPLITLSTLLIGVRLEIKTDGRMQLTHGPSASSRAKKLLGLKPRASREAVADQLEELVTVAKSYFASQAA